MSHQTGALSKAGLLGDYDWDRRLSEEANGLDATRLVLACLVVFGHSYFLVDDRVDNDPLYVLTGGQIYSGQLAVLMFFSISGFLVTRSRLLSGSVSRYLAKRIARIVPGFLVAAFIGYVVIGPLFADDPFRYFSDQNWKTITLSTLALRSVGVASFVGNPVGLVHGTLWTIKLEFDCYLIIGALGGLLMTRRAWVVLLGVGAILAAMIVLRAVVPDIDYGPLALLISNPNKWPALFPFFFVGSALYVFRAHVPLSPWLAAMCGAVIIGGAVWGGLWWALLFTGTYLALFVALSRTLAPRAFGERVDLSYGVYLYGWPIQQMLLYLSGRSLSASTLTVLALLVTLPVAYASWRLVEKPALALVGSRR